MIHNFPAGITSSSFSRGLFGQRGLYLSIRELNIFNMSSLLILCSSVISRLRGKRPSSEIPGNRTPPAEIPKLNTLAGLPVELLFLIADSLLPDDLTCISLCSRRLFAIFNHQTNSARPSGKAKLPILCRLERDLPKYFICHHCHILHEYDGFECFSLCHSAFEQECPLRCFPKWSAEFGVFRLKIQDSCRYHVYRPIYFLHLQLAMRRFYYGPKFGISTDALSYTEVQTHQKEYREISSLFSTDAQICPEIPGLCLRIQHIVFVHGGRSELLLSRPYGPMDDPPLFMYVCEHVSGLELPRLLNTMVNDYCGGNQAPKSAYNCDRCNTDFRIEVCKSGSDLALVLTKWINLGPGLTPDDPQWNIHCYGAWKGRKVTLSPGDRKYSPWACFENTSPRSLEALLSCNISYLKNRQYRKVMRRAGRSWYARYYLELPSKA